MGRIRSVVGGHRRRLLHVVGLLAGLAALGPLVAVDPGILALLLDADLLALVGVAGLGLLRGDVRLIAHRLLRSLPASWVRVGIELTRTSPRSLSA